MLTRLVTRKNAAIVVVILAALLAAATFYPMRRYHEKKEFFTGGPIIQTSEVVTTEMDTGEYFVPSLHHLDTISVYIDSVSNAGVEAGAFLQLFRQMEDGTFAVAAQELIPFPEELPGFIEFPIDADLVPGDTYVYTMRAWDAAFTVGYESMDAALASPGNPGYVTGFYNDSVVNGIAVQTKLVYNELLSPAKTALWIAGILAAAVLICLGIHFWFQKFPAGNTYTSVLRVMQYVGTPVTCICGLIAMVSVWPLRLFDSRPADILVYELGILITILFILYALWHDRRGSAEVITRQRVLGEWKHVLLILLVAAGVGFCNNYVNALSDYDHNINQARLLIVLSLIILTLGRMAYNLNVYTIVWTFASILGSITWYLRGHVPADVKEALQKNQVLGWHAASVVFVGLALISVLLMIIDLVRSPKEQRRPVDGCRPRWYLILPTILFFAAHVIFRNGRTWIVLLALMLLMLYIRFAYFELKDKWLHDICCGIALNFVFMAAYSMLHRYYIAYVFNRFAMSFFTVTVTAYYLMIAASAALTLLMMKMEQTSGMKIRERMPYIYKELAFFGAVSSYMLMSLTRAGVYGLAAIVLAACIIVCCRENRGGLAPLKRLGALILATMITFPAIFSGQRLISTAYDRPVTYELIETYKDSLVRNTPWNLTEFMNIEVFIRDFGDRIIGGSIGSRLYDGLGWNVGQGYYVASLDETELAEPVSMTASLGMVKMALPKVGYKAGSLGNTAEGEAALDAGDFTNGRMDLWKSYLDQLNMTGHTEMGAVLEDGEIAVHAHNIFLQTAYDAGIPTGIFFVVTALLWAFGALFYYLRNRDRDHSSLLPLLVMAGYFSTGLVEWVFHLCNPFTFVLMLCLAQVFFPSGDQSGRQSETKNQ